MIGMTVSQEKTKIMVVSATIPPEFHYNGAIIQQVPPFKFLGLHFRESGDIARLITPLKPKIAAAWATVQQT